METLTELKEVLTSHQANKKELEEKIEYFDLNDIVTDDSYDDLLDDVYGEVEIAGITYSTSRALEQLDPVAYRCGFSDYIDSLDKEDFSEYQDLVTELEDLESEIYILKCEIEEMEEEEEDQDNDQ